MNSKQKVKEKLKLLRTSSISSLRKQAKNVFDNEIIRLSSFSHILCEHTLYIYIHVRLWVIKKETC